MRTPGADESAGTSIKRRELLQVLLAGIGSSLLGSCNGGASGQTDGGPPDRGQAEDPRHDMPLDRPGQTPRDGGACTVVNVKEFGAKGDGLTNDTDAFAAASAKINAQGCGVLEIPPGTYVVGKQIFAGATGKQYSYHGQGIISILNCTGPVEIKGNGAKLVAATGLRYGSFDPVSGARYDPSSTPFSNLDYAASAYPAMVYAFNNRAVSVHDLELDGRCGTLTLGGVWGSQGRETRGSGIVSASNRSFTASDIHSHHQPLDGLVVAFDGLTPSSAATPVTLSRVTCDSNGHAGLYWVGGIGLTATDCRFGRTGVDTGALGVTPPGGGFDLHAENSVCRQGIFVNCEFSDNAGVAFIANTGDGGYTTFRKCTFRDPAGAIWPVKPGLRFEDCNIYGPVIHSYGSTTPALAVHYIRCTFDDTDSGDDPGSNLILLGDPSDKSNVLFDSCTIIAARSRSIYLSNSDVSNPVVIRKTTIWHKWSSLVANGFQCVLGGCVLDSVSFKESLPGPPPAYYIKLNSATVTLQNCVSVSGPCVHWGSPTGPTGQICP